MLGRDGVQARCQKHNLRREDGKFTIGPVLGATTARESNNTNNITSPEVLMLLLKGDAAGSVLALAHDLYLYTLRADIVKVQLGARAALGVDSTGDANGDIGLLLALLEALVVLEELTQVVGDVELVRIGVWVLGFAELVDFLASDFKVLLNKPVSIITHQNNDNSNNDD